MSTENPQVQLRWSRDGGITWSNWISKSVGKTGEYNKLVQWNRLGMDRTRVYQVRYSEATPFAIIGASLNITTGTS